MGKLRLARQIPDNQYRAFCEQKDCGWTGRWRSMWHKWETLIEECQTDLNEHVTLAHPELVKE